MSSSRTRLSPNPPTLNVLGTSPGANSDVSNEAIGHTTPGSRYASLPSPSAANMPSDAALAAFPTRPSMSSTRSTTDDRASMTDSSHLPASTTATTLGGSSTSKMTLAPAAAYNQQQQQQQRQQQLVPTTFDEATLRALCDTDVGLPLLYERIKQSMNSCREASAFFKKRAALEEEYGRSLLKLSKASLESYGSIDGKAGSYVSSYHTILSTHEHLAESRLRFAQRLGEMSEELNTLIKEVDRNRKTAKETGVRLERNLIDAEANVEKARARFDSAAEDLERVLLVKSGESAKGGDLAASHAASGSWSGGGAGGPQNLATKGRSLGKAMSKGGMLFKNSRNPQQLQKQEEEVRLRTSQLSDTFRREVLQTQQMRQEYFNLQLPRILRSLKESAEEIDNGLQYHLTRYAFLYESTVLADGMVITPVGDAAGSSSTPATPTLPSSSIGLKQAAELIDNRSDFKTFMQNYTVLHARDYKGPRREGAYEDGSGFAGAAAAAASSSGHNGLHSPHPSSGNGGAGAGGVPHQQGRPIFGVDLATQMARDNVEVPGILEKCCAAVEQVGKENMGIYRLSGTTSKVQRLKAKFDADWTTVDLFDPHDGEANSDINIVSGCLKLWFRELPEPLLTWELYRSFIDAAKVENDRLRHIRLHEVVNLLPDANYSTLKALMGHLDRVRGAEDVNQMSASNLAIVFGPTLLGPPPKGMVFDNQDDANHSATGEGGAEDGAAGGGAEDGEGSGGALADMAHQSKAVETILVHYRDIFLEDDEIEAAEQEEQRQRRERDAAWANVGAA